jgi:hypothetical protein
MAMGESDLVEARRSVSQDLANRPAKKGRIEVFEESAMSVERKGREVFILQVVMTIMLGVLSRSSEVA